MNLFSSSPPSPPPCLLRLPAPALDQTGTWTHHHLCLPALRCSTLLPVATTTTTRTLACLALRHSATALTKAMRASVRLKGMSRRRKRSRDTSLEDGRTPNILNMGVSVCPLISIYVFVETGPVHCTSPGSVALFSHLTSNTPPPTVFILIIRARPSPPGDFLRMKTLVITYTEFEWLNSL